MTKLDLHKKKLKDLQREFKMSGSRDATRSDQIDNLKMDIEIEKLKERPINKIRLRKAIRNVMEYNWENEEDDYRAHAAANADPTLKGHIFRDLVLLDTWLKRGR